MYQIFYNYCTSFRAVARGGALGARAPPLRRGGPRADGKKGKEKKKKRKKKEKKKERKKKKEKKRKGKKKQTPLPPPPPLHNKQTNKQINKNNAITIMRGKPPHFDLMLKKSNNALVFTDVERETF